MCEEGVLCVITTQDETTRNEFKEEVRNECARCGIIKDIAVPMPPPDADINDTPGRIYVHFQV